MKTQTLEIVDGLRINMAMLPKTKLLLALMSAVFLPVVALASGKNGYDTIIAQSSPLPPGVAEAAGHLADKSMAYWFISLAIVAAISWTWIVKWIINQLEQQRAANVELNTKLLGYVSNDHTNSQVALQRVASALEANTRVLESIDKRAGSA